MKMSLLVLGTAVLFGNLSFADQSGVSGEPAKAPICNLLRRANASVMVTKKSWEQDSGIWVQKSTKLVTSNTEVPVYEESANGCTIENALVIPNLVLNGQTQSLRVSANIVVENATAHTTPNKVFGANYRLSTDTARSGYASAYTPDLTTKIMGLTFNREHAAVTDAAHDESVVVNVYFQDNQ